MLHSQIINSWYAGNCPSCVDGCNINHPECENYESSRKQIIDAGLYLHDFCLNLPAIFQVE
uniref:Uncharacterized protein n=1 Tax=Anguilla anguilla TaxID=7936 RepID=A0A0E9W1A8_ANGAN